MIFTPARPQEIIKEHLLETPNSLLFVGMGIGKSAACLDALNTLFLNCEAIAALVVAPLRVANLTWPMEIRQWDQFNWMKCANLRTENGQRAFLNGRAHIYTINYEGLNTLVSLIQRRGKNKPLPYDVIIFDELTRAKNPSSKRVNTYRRAMEAFCLKGGETPKRQWGLTGTPMPNSWQDLFSQVRLIDGGERLGRNFVDFKRTYFFAPEYNPFAKEGQQDRSPWQPKQNAYATLEGKIADITVTLKSSDWLDIPDTVIEDVEIPFTPELQKKYKTLEEELVIELQKETILNVANSAALITKLLQFTSGHMYDDEKIAHPVHTLKIDALRKIAKEESKPLFVASIFQHEQSRIRAGFPQARFFADAKNEKQQEQMLNDWNAGKIKMLVAHPASVGHGLNFQYGSSILVWLTLTYSREYYEQMIARLARRGQKDITKIYRLMIPGTVDDAVAEALANKAENEARLIRALQSLESYRKNNV